MLGWNSRQNLWVSVQAQLGTLLRQSSPGFVVSLSRQLLMLLSKSVCRDKVVKCDDIYGAPMSSAFVASLLRQCSLTFFFDDCCNKLFIVATKFLFLLLYIVTTKLLNITTKCSRLYLIIVATNFQMS